MSSFGREPVKGQGRTRYKQIPTKSIETLLLNALKYSVYEKLLVINKVQQVNLSHLQGIRILIQLLVCLVISVQRVSSSLKRSLPSVTFPLRSFISEFVVGRAGGLYSLAVHVCYIVDNGRSIAFCEIARKLEPLLRAQGRPSGLNTSLFCFYFIQFVLGNTKLHQGLQLS